MRQHLLTKLIIDHNPDLICLQEIKCQDEQLDKEWLLDLGYNIVHKGQKSYNGVAILSKSTVEIIDHKLGGYDYDEARFLKVFVNDWCVYNVYVTNGQEIQSTAYYKQIEYLTSLIQDLRMENSDKIIVAGDFNVAPTNSDTDPQLLGAAMCSSAMRILWKELLDIGFYDNLRQFTWWDYRFKGNLGCKIDNILVKNSTNTKIDVLLNYRFGCLKPSDHAPLLCIV